MATSHDLGGLIKFLGQHDWNDCFELVIEDHFAPVLETVDMSLEDLRTVLGDSMASTLWGCAFEDFLTQDFDVAGRNIVDDYLKRRGFKEGAQSKAYMKALRTSVMSLYEVSDVVPGVSLMARDLLRGGEPVLVHEGTATKTLGQWDKIAARIVSVMGNNVLAGGLLAFSPEASELIFETVREVHGKRRSKKMPILTDEQLRPMASLFTAAWLGNHFETVIDAVSPMLSNTDGDDMVLHATSFPIAKGIKQSAIAERLDGIEALSRQAPKLWAWLDAFPAKAPLPEDERSFDRETDAGARVLGDVELMGRTLSLLTNSAARAEKGTALLKEALGDLVGEPVTTSEEDVPDDLLDDLLEDLPEDLLEDLPEDLPDLPLEDLAAPSHALLDRIYHRVLDEPVDMLDGASPRQLVKTEAGRRKVVEWIKYLENQTALRNRPGDPMAGYSFLWMWEELGIAELRR